MAVIALVAVALAACSEPEAEQVVIGDLSYEGYLTQAIPPCTPVEGSERDPCGEVEKQGGSGAEGAVGKDAPFSLRFFLDGGLSSVDNTSYAILEAHLVVRATFLPDTIRCETQDTTERAGRSPTYSGIARDIRGEGVFIINCFADIRVNDYVVGTGPTKLPIMVTRKQIPRLEDESVAEYALLVEELRDDLETSYISGAFKPGWIVVPEGGYSGLEKVMFLGPALNFSIASFQVFGLWDLERRDDGTVIVVHPNRVYWQFKEDYETQYRHLVEWTLPEFTTSMQAAQTARLAEAGGRIGLEANLPMLITDANRLRDFHVQAGNVNHPDGDPVDAPAPCGLGAVANQATTPRLMVECMALLRDADELRGTGTLNWDAATSISSWDGVTVDETPQRVTKLELANKSLTGSIPAGLADLELTTLKLAGNSLTGCIPPALREVAVNDLDELGLADCATE